MPKMLSGISLLQGVEFELNLTYWLYNKIQHSFYQGGELIKILRILFPDCPHTLLPHAGLGEENEGSNLEKLMYNSFMLAIRCM